MLRILSSSIVSLAFILTAAGAQQQPGPQPDAIELPFLQDAAKDLNVYATLSFKNGFPREARDLWIELLSEYDRDDAVAREQLGYVAVGSAWQPKPGFEFPEVDVPNMKNARMLEGRWKALCKKLGDGHRKLADKLKEGGNEERADYHYKRALRFQPDDGKAQQQLGARTVEGITGTELDLELLRRSRMLERLVTQLFDQPYEVAQVDLSEPRLDKAQVPYIAVKSPNFTVFGDWEPDVLMEAAQWSERSLEFCKRAFEGYAAWQGEPVVTTKFAFFRDKETWAKVVRANASGVGDPEFVVKYTSACLCGGSGPQGIHLGGQADVPVVYDFAVRKIAHDYSNVSRDALVEGIGHAVVGLFFGRNLISLVAQQKREGGTAVARDYSRFQLPDLETWKDLAREIAFEKATAPAAHLPLISAANFTYEERIKSWSFGDYCLRRDPMLWVELDKASAKAANDFDVMAAFLEATKLPLLQVEDDWRNFYTGDSAALQAIRDKKTPMEAVSKDAPAWIEELNRLRRLIETPQVGWSADFSAACRQHAEYLKKNRGERGPGKENTQDPNNREYSNVGRLFAATAVVSTADKDPRKAMESWMAMPGFRDVLMDSTLTKVGAYADGPILVMDVQRGREIKDFTKTRTFPYPNQRDRKSYRDPLPAAVDVELIGPELQALLDQHGQGRRKEIGFPLTAHFFSTEAKDVRCEASVAGKTVDGVLVHSTVGSRRVAAPGLWVFWPFEPWPKGVEIMVIWTHSGVTDTIIFKTT